MLSGNGSRLDGGTVTFNQANDDEEDNDHDEALRIGLKLS